VASEASHFPSLSSDRRSRPARAAVGIVSAYSRDRNIESPNLWPTRLREQCVRRKTTFLSDRRPARWRPRRRSHEKPRGLSVRRRWYGGPPFGSRSGAWTRESRATTRPFRYCGTFFNRLDTLAGDDESRDEAIALIAFIMQGERGPGGCLD